MHGKNKTRRSARQSAHSTHETRLYATAKAPANTHEMWHVLLGQLPCARGDCTLFAGLISPESSRPRSLSAATFGSSSDLAASRSAFASSSVAMTALTPLIVPVAPAVLAGAAGSDGAMAAAEGDGAMTGVGGSAASRGVVVQSMKLANAAMVGVWRCTAAIVGSSRKAWPLSQQQARPTVVTRTECAQGI